MLGNSELTAVLGATPAPGADPKTWVGYARALARAGLPVMLVEPGSKRPLDMRTETERTRDQEEAHGHNTGGVHLATKDPATLKKYVERALADQPKRGHPAPVSGPLNWAVRLGGSGYVVADADTPGEVAALRAYLAPVYGGEERVPGPTVITPGTADQAHHGGGHWWFKLPDGVDLNPALLPATIPVTVEGHEEGFSLYTGNAYVLVPPSVRPEGGYHLMAADNPVPAPLWALLESAAMAGATRAQRRKEYAERAASGQLGSLEEQVSNWNQATPWEDLLVPHGWSATGTVDSCGCPVWTAPGVHSSPKSATAHESGCTQDRVDVLNPPLHIWTDNPGPGLEDYVAERGTKTISKLNVSAYLDHAGRVGEALEAAGISQDPTGLQFSPEELTAAGTSQEAVQATAGTSREAVSTSSGTEEEGSRAVDKVAALPSLASHVDLDADAEAWVPPREPVDLEEEITTPHGLDMWDAWGVKSPAEAEDPNQLRKLWPPLGPLSRYRNMPPTKYIVSGLLQHQGLVSVIGDSGVGKSAVVLDMAASIVAGKTWHGRKTIQCPVLYVAGEGVSGAVDRLHAWEKAHNCYVLEDQFYLVEEAVLFGGRPDSWAFLAREIRRLGVGLVIFDTLARMSSGLDENSATDMGDAIAIFDRLRRTTNAGVLYVHHTTRGTSHGRGTTALRGALDSEVLVTDTLETGEPFAVNEKGAPVDSSGNPLPGKPLTVMVTKQKNGPDDAHNYVCLTRSGDSMVVTDLEGNVEAPIFQDAEGVTVGRQEGETMPEIADRVVDYVSRFRSEDLRPTMADIARHVSATSRDENTPAKVWRSNLTLAVDYALSHGQLFRVGSGYTIHPNLDD